MSQHAMTAVRAYLTAAGLPEADPKAWQKAREMLLGQGASDRANILTLSVVHDERERILMDAAQEMNKRR